MKESTLTNLPCCYTDDRTEYFGPCQRRRLDGLPMCVKHMHETFRVAVLDGALPLDVLKNIVSFTDEVMKIKQMVFKYDEIYLLSQKAVSDRDARQELLERRKTQMTPDEAKDAVVYYIRLTGDRVKIGTTRNLMRRMKDFRAKAPDLLAIESGGYNLEAYRHHQFEHLRIGREEEFRMEQDLVDHINSLREDGAPRLELEAV